MREKLRPSEGTEWSSFEALPQTTLRGGTGAGAGLSWGKLTRLQGTPTRGKVTPESSLSPWRGPTFRDLPTHSDRSGSASTLMRL